MNASHTLAALALAATAVLPAFSHESGVAGHDHPAAPVPVVFQV
jgi:hypothetical protein